MRNDNGLFVNNLPDGTVQCVGYIINFAGHGAYDPNGRVEATADQIKTHNDLLAQAELEALKEYGHGILYLVERHSGRGDVASQVQQFTGTVVSGDMRTRRSWHNFAGENGRIDVWFLFDGSQWHGVHIGHGEILRVKRNKKVR